MTIQPASLLRLEILFVLSLHSFAFASNPTQDARELLSHSPWTVQVEATMDDPANVPEISSEVPRTITQAGQPNVGNGNLDTNTRWDGQIGKRRTGSLATIPVMVRWDSAAVIRHALEMRHEPDVPALSTAAVDNFVLTVVGLLPASSAKRSARSRSSSDEDEHAQARSHEEILEWFMGNSLILIKGLPDLRPQNVKLDEETGTVRLFFNRSDKVLANKRDIVLVTRYGSMSVQAKFRVKDMLVDGHPDL